MFTNKPFLQIDCIISVIVPVYNTKQFLQRCIDSILNQTYHNTEIILVDDGSTDGSADVCDRYSLLHDNVKVIHQENSGVSAARNRGIEEASGKYIAFVDSDDWIHFQFLETLMYGVEETDAQICVLEPKVITTEKCSDLEISPADVNFQILDWNQLVNIQTVKRYIWGRLFERKLIENIRFQEKLIFCEDTAFNLDLYCESIDLSVAYATTRLYYYYQRSDSAVHGISHEKILTVGEYYLKRSCEVSTLRVKGTMLIEALKSFLSARYGLMFQMDKNKSNYVNNLIYETIYRVLSVGGDCPTTTPKGIAD